MGLCWRSETALTPLIHMLLQDCFAAGATNYTDCAMEGATSTSSVSTERQRAMEPQKKQKAASRTPQKEKTLTTAELASRAKQQAPCCPRPEGEGNPLTKKRLAKQAGLEEYLTRHLVAVERLTPSPVGGKKIRATNYS